MIAVRHLSVLFLLTYREISDYTLTPRLSLTLITRSFILNQYWQKIQRELPRTPGDTNPTKLQEFGLCLLSNGTVSANPSSASLDIATGLLLDIVPHGVTKDSITISSNRFIAFAHEYVHQNKKVNNNSAVSTNSLVQLVANLYPSVYRRQ